MSDTDYSSDLGSSWTYVPASAGCGAPAGYDRCVDRIRWRLLSDLSATPPNHAGSVGFTAVACLRRRSQGSPAVDGDRTTRGRKLGLEHGEPRPAATR